MIKKKYVKSRQVVKVTFELQASELPETIDVEAVHLVGDFNEWDVKATPMGYSAKKKANSVTLEQLPEQEYAFRYLVNGLIWCNDWDADAYVASGFGEDNCLVVTPAG